MIFSFGKCSAAFFVSENVAKISVNPPTRPKNINRIRINLDSAQSCVVMPSVSPTVPIADAVSKSVVSSGNRSM